VDNCVRLIGSIQKLQDGDMDLNEGYVTICISIGIAIPVQAKIVK